MSRVTVTRIFDTVSLVFDCPDSNEAQRIFDTLVEAGLDQDQLILDFKKYKLVRSPDATAE